MADWQIDIDKFRGAMETFNAEYGIFITNFNFTREVMNKSCKETKMIILINGDQICDLVVKYIIMLL